MPSETTSMAPPADVDPAQVAAVRAFTRCYTAVLGVLDEGLLHTPYSVAEARVIYELAQRDETGLAELRRDLRVDAGYMSRIVARLEADGLVTRSRSATDARRQVLALTEQGRAVFATLDARSAAQVGQLLAAIPEPVRRRVVAAMDVVRTVLADERPPDVRTVVLRPPGPGDYGWVVARHGALYADEYGWDTDVEGLVARIVSEYIEHHDPAGRRRGSPRSTASRQAASSAWPGTPPPHSCASSWSNRASGGSASAPAWSTSACSSPGGPGTARSCCGPTTCWCRPAASTRPPGSPSSTRRPTTASGTTWSASTGRATCSRPPAQASAGASMRSGRPNSGNSSG